MNRRKLYKAVFTMGVQHSMEYRFHFFLVSWGRVSILVQYFIWTAVYRHSGQVAVLVFVRSNYFVYDLGGIGVQADRDSVRAPDCR